MMTRWRSQQWAWIIFHGRISQGNISARSSGRLVVQALPCRQPIIVKQRRDRSDVDYEVRYEAA